MKPKLILLHGALGDAKQFQPLCKQLASDFDVLTPDFPGHGNSDETLKEYTIENLSAFLLAYMQSLKAPAYVFGYSMGGYVALWTACHYPERFKGIITLATKLDWNPESVAKETAFLDPDRMLEKIPAYAKLLEERHHKHHWKDVLKGTVYLMTALGNYPLLNREICSRLMLPVWMGLGDRDTMITIDETRTVQQAIPQSAFYTLPNTAHPIEKVDLDWMAFMIRKFAGL